MIIDCNIGPIFVFRRSVFSARTSRKNKKNLHFLKPEKRIEELISLIILSVLHLSLRLWLHCWGLRTLLWELSNEKRKPRLKKCYNYSLIEGRFLGVGRLADFPAGCDFIASFAIPNSWPYCQSGRL